MLFCSVTPNSFQGPSRNRGIALVARWMLKQVQHDGSKRGGGYRPVAVARGFRSVPQMQMLEATLKKFGKRKNARVWVGSRPNVRDGQLSKAIARQVGLPTTNEEVVVGEALVRLNRAEAAHVLAVAATTSLAHGRASPRSSWVADAKHALSDLAEDATFISNGRWEGAPSVSWTPLTNATFECGVIGFDSEHAFIFWVEEED